MHELAVCQALIGQVGDIARRERAVEVTDVHVGIGPLSGVEADLLADAFPMASAGTIAAGATLHLRRTAIRVRCSECRALSEASASRLVCADCGAWRTELVSGDELLLERVELVRPGMDDPMADQMNNKQERARV